MFLSSSDSLATGPQSPAGGVMATPTHRRHLCSIPSTVSSGCSRLGPLPSSAGSGEHRKREFQQVAQDAAIRWWRVTHCGASPLGGVRLAAARTQGTRGTHGEEQTRPAAATTTQTPLLAFRAY
ncbi:hypothetical protein E2C01_052842 [Portunus trituberculatus]|uniref:Uncharacterized protein n=1 Tax=Portunus trituberculatus TaxID=210409 RepID=A0A5B7GIR9_PORTR|nr:hypothetical protein [Portunus trituberculatus]